jgi:AcrR family transcriptional regulator
MGRWKPDAAGRLAAAAMELYSEHGFEQTTVAEIAERAGLTERTFFRHFADKREVLFAGATMLQDAIVNAVTNAPTASTPIDAVAAGLDTIGELIQDRDFSRVRQDVIGANRELQERELIKMATMAAAIAVALRDRGVPEPAASLTAEAGIAVFKIAFARWIEDANEQTFPLLMRDSLDALKAVTSGS